MIFDSTIRWDNGNIPKGQKRNHLIGLNDVYATICELIGVPVPPNQAIDSISFASYVFNETSISNLRTYLGTWDFQKGKLAKSSIRRDNMKLVHHYETNQMDLYDLDKDIGETTNLLNDESKEKVNERVAMDMFKQLKRFGPCYDNRSKFLVTLKNGKKLQRKCWWFRQKPNRCYKYLEVRN